MPVRPNRPPEAKTLALDLRGLGADGVFSGYASLFGETDLARDTVERGAFAASLARRGVMGVKMLWHHDPAEPIGLWSDIREDARGLAVTGRILTDLARGREALVLLRAGAVDGLSIGFRTVRAVPEAPGRKGGGRRLMEVDLWEISLVTFPMLPAARVAAVKATGPGDLAASIRRAARRLTLHP